MQTQSEHDAQVMKIIEAIVKSYGGSVVFTLQGEGYRAHIDFPDSVSKEQELACGQKVVETIERLGGELI